jgi:NADH-quinone oxidoreductase subunit B
MTDLGMPTTGPPPVSPDPSDAARVVVQAGRTWSRSVFDLGLACCAVELAAATAAHPELAAGARGQEGDRVEVMVVSGTVTDKLAPAVLAAYQRLPEPRAVLSFGSCANSGGPYWDSYCVTKGVDQLVPVDVYVPGCPPRPEALLAGLRLLEERLGLR